MDTELWIRNPNLCIRECLELGVSRFTWDRGLLKTKGIDIKRFMSLYYGETRLWQAMLIGEQGATLVNNATTEMEPAAVYPVWTYGDDWALLEELCQSNPGDDPWACSDPAVSPELRPRPGQAHYVVITYTPQGNSAIGKQFYQAVRELQLEYPDCRIHVHGLYSYRLAFAMEYGSVDIDPRTLAAKGKITLPTGLEVTPEGAIDHQHWITMFGWTLGDMRVPRNRCMYNIKSAEWAAANFREQVKFHYKGFEHIDPDNPTRGQRARRRGIMVRRVNPLHTDKFLCDTCSLQSACEFFRVGAVCAVPGSDPTELSAMFKTRDATTIKEGLATLLGMEAERVGLARQSETTNAEINPEVTRMIDRLFKHGVELVKLEDPSFRPQGAVSNSQTNNIILGGDTAQLTATIMNEFVKMGIPRDQVTTDMVMAVIETPEGLRDKAMQSAVAARALQP